MELKFIIVGGGIHGVYMANMLLRHGLATQNEWCIIDPNDEPLSNWKRVTSNVRMDFLRSPKVHHLDTEPFSLKHFSKEKANGKPLFISPNDRPSLRLFNNHANWVLEKNRIRDRFYQGSVECVTFENGFAAVSANDQVLRSEYVILATGQGKNTNWPDWALAAKEKGAKICHVLEKSFSRCRIPDAGPIAVIGGGMSAVHTALCLSGMNRKILLITPHSIRQHDYDADPGWMGPKYMNHFRKIRSAQKRREVITSARNTGTVTRELKQKLLLLEKKRQCTVYTDSVAECTPVSESLMLIRLSGGDVLSVNHVVLATGYRQTRPGGTMVDLLVGQYGLRCSECGFPIPDTSLRWHKRLFVTGPLAELEVGPVARNIIGAKMAAEKVVKSFRI